MPELVDALAGYAFLRLALMAGLLASLSCGVVGSFVVVRRLGYLAGGVAHAVLGGMGAAYYLGYPPMGGAVVAAVVAAAAVAWVSLRFGQHEDVLISALWAVGMATGVVFISQTPGYATDLMSYLFGNILLVSGHHLVLMLVVDLVLVTVTVALLRPLTAVTFDEEFARARGLPVTPLYVLLLVLIALTAVLLIPVAGLILVVALLTLPAATAGQGARSLAAMMAGGVLVGVAVTVLGLVLSFRWDWPAGATMVIVAGCVYVLSVVGVRAAARLRAARSVQ